MRMLLAHAALALLAALSLFAAAADKSASVTFNVSNMTCELCPITVKKALQGVPGVVSAKTDFATKTATVSYDPNVTNAQALIQATTNAGYPSAVKK